MRRHVLGVARRRSDPGVDSRRLQPHRRMLAVVERVERVVRGAGVFGILLQNRGGNATGFERTGRVALALGNRRQQRQRVEGRRFIVGRKSRSTAPPCDPRRRGRARPLSLAEQALNGVEIPLLARCRRFRLARGWRGARRARAARALPTSSLYQSGWL